jgi:hypothetical protein
MWRYVAYFHAVHALAYFQCFKAIWQIVWKFNDNLSAPKRLAVPVLTWHLIRLTGKSIKEGNMEQSMAINRLKKQITY